MTTKFLLALTALASGCGMVRPSMRAEANCAFKAGTRYASRAMHQYWKEDPEGKCSFSLQAPIKKADDAVKFSQAFERMLTGTPKPAEISPVILEKKAAQ